MSAGSVLGMCDASLRSRTQAPDAHICIVCLDSMLKITLCATAAAAALLVIMAGWLVR